MLSGITVLIGVLAGGGQTAAIEAIEPYPAAAQHQIAAQHQTAVQYQIDVEDPATGRVVIRATFPSEGHDQLRLIDRGRELVGDGDSMEALTRGARAEVLETSFLSPQGVALPVREEGAGWTVLTQGAATVSLRRVLRVPDRTLGGGLQHPYASGLSVAGGVLLGLDLFPELEGNSAPLRLKIVLPPAWDAVTAWPESAGTFRPPSLQALLRDFVAVGPDLQISQRSVGRQTFRVCAPASLEASLPDYAEVVLDVAEEARRTLGMVEGRHFLVVLQVFEGTGHQRMLSHRGANGPRSVVVYVDPRFPEAFAEHPLCGVVHEIVHWWIGRALHLSANHPWFTEGATTYFEHLLLLRAGVVDFDFFVQSLVDTWHRSSSGRPSRWSLEEASARFTRDESATMLVYQRGALIAFALDLEMRAAGRSLAELVRRLVFQGMQSADSQSPVAILRGVRDLAGPEVLRRLRERLASRDPIELAEWLRSLGYDLVVEWAPLLGVRLSPAERPTVDMVQPGNPAEGRLLPGDVLCAIDGESFVTPREFEHCLRSKAAGQTVSFQIERAGQRVVIELALGRRPEPRARPAEQIDRAAREMRAALSGVVE